jgi:putative membrane protein
MILVYWYGHDMGWWGYIDMAVLMAVFWVLVLGSLAALVKYLLGNRSTIAKSSPEPASPADVLASRFARGEITESEYRDRITVLRECGTQR